MSAVIELVGHGDDPRAQRDLGQGKAPVVASTIGALVMGRDQRYEWCQGWHP
jgi:hypothetical protein